jgi:very-short-patch-repair endonuclease
MKDLKQNKNNTPTPPFLKGAGGIKSRYLPYNKNLKQLSRNLRNNSTLSEIILWKELRAADFGYTFNRQKPILNFIVDFYCKPLNLVIEVDGISHWDEEQVKQDEIRQKKLEELGLRFIRFDDNDVLKDRENVCRAIELTIEELEKIYPMAKRRKKVEK